MGITRLFILGLAIATRALATEDPGDDSERWSGVEPLWWTRASCRLRVTLSCEPGSCLDARYRNRPPSPLADGFMQVTIGEVPKLMKLMDDPSGEAWWGIMDFDCVEPWSTMVFALYSGSMLPLASCERLWETEASGSMSGACEGLDGIRFMYQVEHGLKPEAGVTLQGELPSRALLTESSSELSVTPTPSPSPMDTAPPTVDNGANEAVPTPDPTEQPTNVPLDPSAAPIASTSAPAPLPTPAIVDTPMPVTPSTPAPSTTPIMLPTTTDQPMTLETISPPTGAPVAPTPTPAPTEALPALPEPTPAPQATPTPEPSPAPAANAGPDPTPSPMQEPTTEAPAAQTTSAPIVIPESTPGPIVPDTPTETPNTLAPVTPPTPGPVIVSQTTAPNVVIVESPSPTSLSPTLISTAPEPNPTASPSATPSPTPISLGAGEPTVVPTVVLTGTPSVPAVETTVPITAGVTQTPVLTPTPVTSPPTEAPVEATPMPVIESTPAPLQPVAAPTPAAVLTPVPSTSSSDGYCGNPCDYIVQEHSNLGSYYDETCQGDGDNGCNLDLTPSNPEYMDCRRCYLDIDAVDDDERDEELGECPCCVVITAGYSTDRCDSQAVPTPSPMTSLTPVDLETDPYVLVMAFSQEDCTARGMLIENGDTRRTDVRRFVGDDDTCEEPFKDNTVYGTLCESEDELTYSVTIDSDKYIYSWEGDCEESSDSRRRRLEEDVEYYNNMELLCNDNDRFVAVFDLDEDDKTGLIYAQNSAQGFEELKDGRNELSTDYCLDANGVINKLMGADLQSLVGAEDMDTSDGGDDSIDWIIILAVVAALVVMLVCLCCILYRRKGKSARADQMRRNLGYTPDMESKGEGNFGPTATHVAITRGGCPKPTPEMLATKAFQGSYPIHNRAPSEAPSSIIENNIANNYRPKQAHQVWQERRVRKELTKPPTHQNVVTGGSGNASEELKTENVTQSVRSSDAPRSEQLSEASLSKLEQERKTGAALPAGGAPAFPYEFGDDEVPPEVDDEDDDARSAITGMSGPSKYAPSGYAPSSHHGVTHDQLSHYEPSVYEADSSYDPSIYGRESEFGDDSTYYSHDARSSHRGGYIGRGRSGHHVASTRGSVADTAAASHLGSVMEMDDGDDGGHSAYAPSESYVSSYVSSEDDDGRPARLHHPRSGANGSGHDRESPASGYTSRHSAHRSGRESITAGRGFGAGNPRVASTRHHGGRSGFEHDSRDYDEEDTYDGGHESMDDVQFFDDDGHSQVPSSQGAPLTAGGDSSSSKQAW